MRVKLLRDARIKHRAGDEVEINDQRELEFLISTGSAVMLRKAAPEAPEDQAVHETRTPARRSTRKVR